MAFVFEPLGPEHDRRTFSCGQPALDDWFRQRAGQDVRRDVARVFVARDAEGHVAGFYSLCSFAFAVDDLPPALARRLPRYGLVPAVLIGRLARHHRWRGAGLGELLLADAIRRIVAASAALAVFAIVVDAKDDPAVAFYGKFGFAPFPGHPRRLFLPLATAKAALP